MAVDMLALNWAAPSLPPNGPFRAPAIVEATCAATSAEGSAHSLALSFSRT
jgi:hypothetical protein